MAQQILFRSTRTHKPTSQYRGVSWNKAKKMWVAKFRQKIIGYFYDELEAARAYNAAAVATHGAQFATQNIFED